MNRKLAVTFALACISSPLFAAGDIVVFSGTVKQGQSQLTFDVSVPAGKSSQLILADGTKIAFSAAVREGEAMSSVRLFDLSGAQVSGAAIPGNSVQRGAVHFAVSEGRIAIDTSPKLASVPSPAS
jgi:hypothetical protein